MRRGEAGRSHGHLLRLPLVVAGLSVTLYDAQNVIEHKHVRLRADSGGVVEVGRQVGLLACGREQSGTGSVEGGGVTQAVALYLRNVDIDMSLRMEKLWIVLLVMEADIGGGGLVETFLENFVQVHRVLLSGDGVHLLVTDLCSESLVRLAGWSPLDMENTGNFHSSKLY